MKILIFNWRDTKHPSSGGAEILTHELAKRWVKNGHTVVQFSSLFKGAKKNESIDGVSIIRKGHPDARYLFWSVHFLAFWHYMLYFRGKFDVLIDEIHGLPFFSPIYVKERKVALICEVADEIWYKMYGYFFGSIGRMIEIFYLRTIYRNMTFLTISNSTKFDLIKNGVRENHITVIPMGIRLPKLRSLPLKESKPTLLFVGRLSKPKGVEDVIHVLRLVQNEIPSVKLWIVGRGEDAYTTFLKELSKKLGVEDYVKFFGFVSEEEKFQLMARAHVLIVPSLKEGFGLIIPEAGFVGTPAIGYNVEGLRDILIDGVNGLLVEHDISYLKKAVIELLSNKKRYQAMQKRAKAIAKSLSFDASAAVTFKAMNHEAI